MSLADLIAQGGAVAGAPDIAGSVLSGVQMGRQAQMQGLQADALRQESQSRGLANLAAQRTQGDIDAVRQAQNQFTTAGPDGLQLDQGGYLASLARGGRAGIGLSEQSRMQMQQLSQNEAQIAEARRQHKALADVLYGVKGPMDFAAALPTLEKLGVDISTLRSAPFRNDWKDVLEQQISQGMDLESKLKQAEFQVKTEKEAAAQRAALLGQELNQQRFDLQMAQFNETQRQNRESNKLGWYRAEKMGATGAAGGKAPVGYRYTANGDLEAIPGGPADAKAQALANQRASGSTDVAASLATLRDAYDRLEAGGGITSTKKGPLGNIIAAGSSSAVGQMVGRATGSKNQSARNDIAMSRPALLGALMKATGMSAKQMDSNAELKLWLATATDPTLDVESNRRALDALERKYMSGATPAGPATPTTVTSQSQYDALPAGTEYVDGNGVPHVKRGR